MKKVFPVVALILVALLAYYVYSSKSQSPQVAPTATTSVATENTTSSKTSAGTTASNEDDTDDAADGGAADDDQEGLQDQQDRPAAEVYKSADEALTAIKQAAVNYDDLVLEQFTMPGEDCSWCESFYGSVRDMMMSPEVNQDQRSYFAEVLAVSGRVDNIKALVDAVKNAPNSESADMYAEALELTVGKDNVVNYLGDQLGTDNDLLREAAVAAITNQGSRLAVDLLYKHTTEKGDPDGYYSTGIGLGELVPDEEAMPRLQELMLQRDQYSHLAVKALLNGGTDGLKLVLDALGNSKNADQDREMLKDAVDHVSWDEETMALVDKAIASSPSPLVVEFAKKIKEDLKPDQDAGMNPPGDDDSTAETTPQ